VVAAAGVAADTDTAADMDAEGMDAVDMVAVVTGITAAEDITAVAGPMQAVGTAAAAVDTTVVVAVGSTAVVVADSTAAAEEDSTAVAEEASTVVAAGMVVAADIANPQLI
jgi:hypothetical protein